jgi:hypothetical protein
MPQMQFPFFPEGVTHITPLLAFSKRDGRITYLNGDMPVFIHDEEDTDSFRMITAQFCVNGNTKQIEIIRAFGISKISIKRAVKLYREAGPKGFYPNLLNVALKGFLAATSVNLFSAYKKCQPIQLDIWLRDIHSELRNLS